MYLFAPIAYPIAKLLDWVLGEGESHTYKKVRFVAPYPYPCSLSLSLFLLRAFIAFLDELDSHYRFPLSRFLCGADIPSAGRT
jgi:hypothetical protein